MRYLYRIKNLTLLLMNPLIIRSFFCFFVLSYALTPLLASSEDRQGLFLKNAEIYLSSTGDFSKLPPRSGKMRTKPYWLWYAAGGIGYEVLDAQSVSVEESFQNRTPLLRSSFTGGVMKAIGERFGASFNIDYGRRHDRFSIPGQTATGSSVETSSAYFSDLNVLASINYLVPTRGCDFQLYAGVGYSVLQNWTGDRIYRDEVSQEVAFNTASPYETKDVSNRLRYTIGTRAAKPLNEFIYLVFDSQVLLQSEYDVSDISTLGNEIGNSVNIRIGVGYRLEKGRR